MARMDHVNMTKERMVRTWCGMCAFHCGINVHLRGDIIVKITPSDVGPRKTLCIRSAAIPEFEYSNQRLMYPLKKVKGNFKRISWDEALDFIATKLDYIKEKYGPQSLTLHYGHGIFIQAPLGLLRLWAETYGTSNIMEGGFICQWNRHIGSWLTLGGDIRDQIADTKCILNWATSSYHSQTFSRHVWADMKKRGIKVIVIDPRVTHEVKTVAALHLRPRPGTDWALALGLINVIISEGLYDKDFVNKWTIGFDKLAKAVADDYTPEKVAEITSVPAHLIREAAEMYATTKPATLGGGYGIPIEQTSHAWQTRRAQAILIAITGNCDITGLTPKPAC